MNHIGRILGHIDVMENHPSATDEDKRSLDQIKKLLHGRVAPKIERSLAEADVKSRWFLIVDIVLAHLTIDAMIKEFLKKMIYSHADQNKRLAEIRLIDLKLGR